MNLRSSNSNARPIWPWIIAAVLLLVGAVGMVQRLTQGLYPTHLNSYTPWGIWAAVYEFLVWLEVGSLMIFSVLYYTFGWKQLKAIKPTVYLAGLVIMVMALTTIAMDLGQMFRFWRVYLTPDFRSPLTWMVWLHTLYMVILALKLKAALQGDEALGRWLHRVSLPMGVLLISVAGSVFGVVAARPLWNITALPLHFLMASLLAGGALIVLQIRMFSYQFAPGEADQSIVKLRPILLGLLVVATYGAVMNGVLILVPQMPANVEAVWLALTGPYWWSFWILHIGIGVMIPAVLLLITRRARWIVVAAAMIVAGFSALPPNIVIPALATESMAGLAASYQDARLHLTYFPSINEWLVLVFVTGMGGLMFLIGRRALRLTEPYLA